jgi:hypothetical protein
MQDAVADLGKSGQLEENTSGDYCDRKCNQGGQQIIFGMVSTDGRTDLFVFLAHISAFPLGPNPHIYS